MKVPFMDLDRIHRPLMARFQEAMARVVTQGDFILGRDLEEFERGFASFCETPHAVGVGSGTDALHLALRAVGIGPGDEVITVPNTFVATPFAVSYTGAVPVFADVDPDTGLMDPDTVAAAVTPRTKAVIPVHLFGYPAPMGGILDLAASRDLLVIEDACQAHGARLGGRRAGTFGLAGCFSFYPAKNLGAFGDGGMVVTADDGLAARLRSLRNYASPRKYEHDELGFNCRLDTLQAAVLSVKLAELERWNRERREAADQYRRELAGSNVVLFPRREGEEEVYHLFVVRVGDRDRIRAFLGERGVGTGIHYPVPLHLTPAYRCLGHGPGSFPVAERLAGEILSLPIFPGITPVEVSRVVECLLDADPPPLA
jgi:dTDP-4-amino-4,6-dideoxygalactose transaminase